jgi:tripartite motif-containing protein 71
LKSLRKKSNYLFIIIMLSFTGSCTGPALAQLEELEKPQIPPPLNNTQIPSLKTPEANSKIPGVVKPATQHFFPRGIAVDSSGNVFVSDQGPEDTAEYRMIKFTSNGMYIKSWGHYGTGNGEFNIPGGVSVDLAGHVFVADILNDRIQKFDNNGAFMKSWSTVGVQNGWGPEDISVHLSSGNVFVADTENERVAKYTNNGAFLNAGGQFGSLPAKFNLPIGITVDPEGNMFISDDDNYRIQWFKISSHCRVGQIQLWSGVCFVTTWGSQGVGNGQFSRPHGIAWDHAGHVFVADEGNNRIEKFLLSNSCPKGVKQITAGVCFVTTWGTKGAGNGQFNHPIGVAVDENTGNVFVADILNHRIQKFTNNGVFISKWLAPPP